MHSGQSSNQLVRWNHVKPYDVRGLIHFWSGMYHKSANVLKRTMTTYMHAAETITCIPVTNYSRKNSMYFLCALTKVPFSPKAQKRFQLRACVHSLAWWRVEVVSRVNVQRSPEKWNEALLNMLESVLSFLYVKLEIFSFTGKSL